MHVIWINTPQRCASGTKKFVKMQRHKIFSLYLKEQMKPQVNAVRSGGFPTHTYLQSSASHLYRRTAVLILCSFCHKNWATHWKHLNRPWRQKWYHTRQRNSNASKKKEHRWNYYRNPSSMTRNRHMSTSNLAGVGHRNRKWNLWARRQVTFTRRGSECWYATVPVFFSDASGTLSSVFTTKFTSCIFTTTPFTNFLMHISEYIFHMISVTCTFTIASITSTFIRSIWRHSVPRFLPA